MPDNDALDALEAALVSLNQTLIEVGVTVADFQAESAPVLHGKINSLVEQFAALERNKSSVDGVLVPGDLMDRVEQGASPDTWTRELLEATASANQKTNGRIQAIKGFRDALMDEIARELPDLHREYAAAVGAVKAAPAE